MYCIVLNVYVLFVFVCMWLFLCYKNISVQPLGVQPDLREEHGRGRQRDREKERVR